MKKKLTALMIAIVLALTAFSAALADGQIRILPVDLSGGASVKKIYRDNPDFREDPAVCFGFQTISEFEQGILLRRSYHPGGPVQQQDH